MAPIDNKAPTATVLRAEKRDLDSSAPLAMLSILTFEAADAKPLRDAVPWDMSTAPFNLSEADLRPSKPSIDALAFAKKPLFSSVILTMRLSTDELMT